MSVLYKVSVSTAQYSLSTSDTKTKLLMLYKANVAVCSENKYTESNHHVEFLNVKSGGT